MQPWYPVSSSKMSISASPAKKSDGKKDKSPVKTVPKITTTGFDPDAIAELKQALEVSSCQIFQRARSIRFMYAKLAHITLDQSSVCCQPETSRSTRMRSSTVMRISV